ncbi:MULTISPECIES: hypothetical protein [Actinomyces]|uniref:GTPase-associated protein 1 N-terminal domain-containing protein n=1 Tax=Actinomyces respiraculi TaxID=2744574 RepID=A0A7T0PV53_9ACTO|nr:MULTISPECIES: hypothetical protein [Actinomyces]QPL04926.1 hypothetical protein ID810_09260 [Actinomyces respiraculi]
MRAEGEGLHPSGVTSSAQLLYTNVDRVVGGQQRSGWQIMATSDTMTESMADWIRSLVNSDLSGFSVLPGFPTPEQITQAERRLRQVPLDHGVLLLHTAPAGVDTTGRTNSMTHAVILPDTEAAPALRTAELWRSPGWVTPFGPTAVREAALPDLRALVPGTAAGGDAVAEFLTEDGRAEILVALADVLAPVLDARALADGDRSSLAAGSTSPTVLMGVGSTDEAALWLSAVQHCCAPITSRFLGYSTAEVIATPTDLDAVVSSSTDLAFVPHEVLRGYDPRREDVVVIDSRQTGPVTPVTTWGLAVAAAVSDIATWVAAQDALHTALSMLEDHHGLTAAWPLCVAEIMEPGLLTSTGDANLDRAIDRELIRCMPAAVAKSDYLTELIGDWLLSSTDADAAAWYAKVMAVPEDAPVAGVVTGLVRAFVESAVRDLAWLQDDVRQTSPSVVRCLATWSLDPAQSTVVRDAVREAERLVPDDPVSTLRLADRLTRDGLRLNEEELTRLVVPAVHVLVSATGPEARDAILAGRPCPQVMATVRTLVNDSLREIVGRSHVTLPLLDPRVASWLDTPHALPELLETEAALATLSGEVPTPSRAAGCLARFPVPFTLRPKIRSLFSRAATPVEVAALTRTCADRQEIWTEALVRHPLGEGAVPLAAGLLALKNHSDSEMLARRYQRVSPPTAAAVLALGRSCPFLTGVGLTESVTYAYNMLMSLDVLDARYSRDAEYSLDAWGATEEQEILVDLAVLVMILGLWGTHQPVDLSGLSPRTGELAASRAEWLSTRVSDSVFLRTPSDHVTGPLLDACAIGLYLGTAGAKAYPDEAGILKAAEDSSPPWARDRAAVVTQVLRTWTAGWDDAQRENWTSYLVDRCLPGSDLPKWLDKQILRPGSGLFSRFGGGR